MQFAGMASVLLPGRYGAHTIFDHDVRSERLTELLEAPKNLGRHAGSATSGIPRSGLLFPNPSVNGVR
jgi:hypothetical protein